MCSPGNHDWSLSIGIPKSVVPQDLRPEDIVSGLKRRLSAFCPVVSAGPKSVELTVAIGGSSLASAVAAGLEEIELAVKELGGVWSDVKRLDLEVVSVPTLAKEREEAAPRCLGVSEVADLLGVSKQRVSQLMRTTGFPEPLQHLAATPLWLENPILRYAESRAHGRRSNNRKPRERVEA